MTTDTRTSPATPGTVSRSPPPAGGMDPTGRSRSRAASPTS